MDVDDVSSNDGNKAMPSSTGNTTSSQDSLNNKPSKRYGSSASKSLLDAVNGELSGADKNQDMTLKNQFYGSDSVSFFFSPDDCLIRTNPLTNYAYMPPFFIF